MCDEIKIVQGNASKFDPGSVTAPVQISKGLIYPCLEQRPDKAGKITLVLRKPALMVILSSAEHVGVAVYTLVVST